ATPVAAAPSSRRCPSATAAAASSRRPSRQQCVDARVPRDALRDRLAGPAPRLRLLDIPRELGAGLRDRTGVRLHDEPRLAVAHDLERPAGVERRDYGLLGEERLVRDDPA